MLKGFVRLAACAASGAAFLALTGCGGAAPDDGYAGPPPSGYDRGAAAPTLMGSAPAKPATDGLAGGPRAFTGMAPIPNPGDLSKADRIRFYGHKYDYLPEPKGRTLAASTGAPRFQLITRRKSDGTLQISMRPIANPEDMTAAERRRVYGNRYAPRAVAATPRRSWRTAPAATPVVKPVVKPVVVAKASPAPAVKPAPKPAAAAPLAPAAPASVIAPAAPAAPKLNPAQQLQAAVSPAINRGAALSVPADLKAGKEADVVLSLPGDLLAMVQEQAAKLGLGKAAKKVDAYAKLQGQGYEINPPGQQTAPVAAGKPTTFSWKVKPTAAEKAPLRADYGLELKGAKPTTAFSVGSAEEFVAAPVEAAKDAAKGFKWPSLKMPSLKALAFPWVPEYSLPGVGKVARENTVGGALALLALILLVILANSANANRARNERRRKFRTMQDYGVNEQEHGDHDAHHTSYVNPMIAAAAGAAGGYALASHGHDDHGHDDHGHGHDDHGHDDHGHGHDDHGQGDQGHGHDDHGHGHDDHGAHHTSHDAHGHDDQGHGHDDHGHGNGHGHDEPGHGHDDHGHGHDDHGAHHTAALASHGHDDHGHGHDDHEHGDGHGHGHDDHGHGDGHGHDDHGHGPAQHIAHTPVSGHDDHGHDDHGHGHDDHGHDSHGHDDHHKEPEHAH